MASILKIIKYTLSKVIDENIEEKLNSLFLQT